MAGFKDNRFSPIQPAEVPKLSCGISVLSDFEDIEDPIDWEVGKHGIEIEFEIDGKKYRGTYLPHVASEQNWSQEEALDSLFKKAGYSTGTLEDVKGKFSLLRRYQSFKFEISYNSYKQMAQDNPSAITPPSSQ